MHVCSPALGLLTSGCSGDDARNHERQHMRWQGYKLQLNTRKKARKQVCFLILIRRFPNVADCKYQIFESVFKKTKKPKQSSHKFEQHLFITIESFFKKRIRLQQVREQIQLQTPAAILRSCTLMIHRKQKGSDCTLLHIFEPP